MYFPIQGLGNLLEGCSGINVSFLGNASEKLFHEHLIHLLNCCPGILSSFNVFFSSFKALLRDLDTF